MGFPPSTQHLQKSRSAAVEKTHCSHTFHKVNICTSKLFISLIPSHLHSKTPPAALVTTAGEDPQKCKHEKNRTEQIPRDAGDPQTRHPSLPGRIPQVVPGALLSSPSIPAHHPKPPSAAWRPPCPSWPRALAHMFAHAGTEREGKPGCRNNTGTQTKEHKPLIWVNQRK